MQDEGLTACFVADCVALDFLNSAGSVPTAASDWLANGARFLAWLDRAKLVPRDVVTEYGSSTAPAILDELAARARELRGWLRELVESHRGRSLGRLQLGALQLLNEILRADERYCQISTSDSSAHTFALRELRRWRSPDSLLRPLAEEIAKLICDVDFAQIKSCERCGLMFLDRTRRQARKWCSMSRCGNRAKQAAHRRRRSRFRH